jgi:MFS family permease
MLAVPGVVFIVPVALVLTGFAGAFGWISGAAIGASLAPPGRRGLMMGVIGAANGLGIITSSVLALLLVGADSHVQWRLVWLVQAGIAIVTLLPALKAPGLLGEVRVRTRPHRLGGLTAAYGCVGVGYAWFATYYVASIDRTNHISGAAMWSVVGVGSLVGSVLFGIWSDAWGRQQVLVVSQVVAAVACAVMIVASETLAGGIVGGLLFGAVLTGMASLVPAALADMVGNEAVAASFASLTLTFAGGTIGPRPSDNGPGARDHGPRHLLVNPARAARRRRAGTVRPPRPVRQRHPYGGPSDASEAFELLDSRPPGLVRMVLTTGTARA